MPETMLQAPAPAALTSLTEDETLFRDNIRQFADEKIRPGQGDGREGRLRQRSHPSIFSTGTHGDRDSRAVWRRGGKFFEAILAVEELSRVDASAGVIVDVQNTLVNNALLRWTSEEQKKRYLPRMVAERAALTRSAKPARAPTLSRCRPKPN